MSSSPSRGRRGSARPAFTLVELLVVIGIIALLMSILLPTLGRVRMQSNAVKCLSNMRQIGMALTAYSIDNKGVYPAPSVGAGLVDDWVYWQPARLALRDSDSRIATYLGGKMPEGILVCPTDTVESHINGANAYPFSYTVNENICQHYARVNKTPLLKFNKIVEPTTKIILICESSQSVDDGCWRPQNWASDQKNILSRRHDREDDNKADGEKGRGNAVFVDGHGEYIQRRDALRKSFYDPAWRPGMPE